MKGKAVKNELINGKDLKELKKLLENADDFYEEVEKIATKI
jgi:hypothetical protein